MISADYLTITLKAIAADLALLRADLKDPFLIKRVRAIEQCAKAASKHTKAGTQERRYNEDVVNPRQPTDRTRFYIKYAQQHGVRLSALLFYLACHSYRDYSEGLRGQRLGWRTTLDKIGKELDISSKQVSRLLEEAGPNRGRANLLNWKRCANSVAVWLTSRDVFAEHAKAMKGNYVVGHYRFRYSRLLGVNGSVITGFLKQSQEYCGYDGIARRFQWITKKAAERECLRLYDMGVIQRKQSSISGRSIYYRRQRNAEDRRKWANQSQLRKMSSCSAECPLPPQNVLLLPQNVHCI